jgi:hypothetical protein
MEEDDQHPDGEKSPRTAQTAYRKPNGDQPRDADDPIVLPPGTSSEKFKEFTLRLASLCGEENVTVVTRTEELKQQQYEPQQSP